MKVKVKVAELVEDVLHAVPEFVHVVENVEDKTKASEVALQAYVKHVEDHLKKVIEEVKQRVLVDKKVKVTARVSK